MLEGDREELGGNPRLALSHILDPLNIPAEVAKTTTWQKLILLLARNITQTIGDKDKNVLRKTYPSGKQYLALPETKEGRVYSIKFTRPRAGSRSWEIPAGLRLLLIKIRIMEIRNKKKRDFGISR